jgi:ferrochelatase
MAGMDREPDDLPYDAVLVLSFGGPEGPEDVVPYLENVTRGRGIPRERLAQVGAHYDHFGGVSPINAQNRALVAALEAALLEVGLELPVYWGNRNWHPMIEDTVARMGVDGVRRAITFVTSAYSSYSGCRQYREDLARAQEYAGPGAPVLDRIRQFYDHPAFVGHFVRATRAALDDLASRTDQVVCAAAPLVFTAHSLPVAAADRSGPNGGAYVAQLRETARLVVDGIARETGVTHDWELVFQSRSGRPSDPWLEPDVSDHLTELARDGATSAVLVPIGFVSDHVEVLWDLDVVAAATAADLGLPLGRAATPGDDPAFVAMVRDLVLERVRPGAPREAIGRFGPSPDRCAIDCCLPPSGTVLPAVGSA